MIRKEHGKFVLRASSGWALGRHTTKAGAQRQEPPSTWPRRAPPATTSARARQAAPPLTSSEVTYLTSKSVGSFLGGRASGAAPRENPLAFGWRNMRELASLGVRVAVRAPH